MPSLLIQAFWVFIALQLIFAYFEYRYKEDIFYAASRLFNEKYLIPSLVVPAAYVVLVILLKYLLS